ncbi:ATP-binding protein, partial [Pseudomonas baetica]|uniref:ATP-binding protein n=1 Tax=Pseudomonas baetica TaxID=674054 RepID=UPI002871707B
MPRLRVKHFGPIRDGVKNNGWIELKRVTVFVGNQGSGKSTLAKLYESVRFFVCGPVMACRQAGRVLPGRP